MTALGRISGLRPAQARIDLDRLDANYRAVAAFAGRPVMPVVKADAYGHGAAWVARRFETLGVPMLAVAYAEEGAALRAAGVQAPIVVLAGFAAGQEPLVRAHGLTPVVGTPGTLARTLAAVAANGRMRVHVKVDTGMTRLGFAGVAFDDAVKRLRDSGLVDIDGAMTHLAAADEDAKVTEGQLDRFDEAVARVAALGVRPRWVHAANSAGLAFLRPGHTLGRPGLLLYGLKPRPLSPPIEVKPVMQVSARIAAVKDVPAGTPVSYGGRWVAPRPSRIATIPLGYADGVPRTQAMADRGEFSVHSGRVPVRGSVCMDFTMVDLTDRPDVAEDDEAVLFGDGPDAWDVAERADTIAWEVVTRVGQRVPRVYVEAGRVAGVESPFRGVAS